MAITNPALYAVVPTRKPVEQPAKRKRTSAEIGFAERAEFRTKKAVDRADAILNRLEERAANYAKQIAQLQKRKAAALARAARIEDACLTRMLAAGLDSVAGFHVSFAQRNAPAALDVLDETKIPREFWRSKTVESVDKNAVKDALAKGVEVEGVRLTSKVSLVRR